MSPRRFRLAALGAVLVVMVAGGTLGVSAATTPIGKSAIAVPIPRPAPPPRTPMVIPRPPWAPQGVLHRYGRDLLFNGKPYTYVSLSSVELTTWWAVNWGCGAQVSNAALDQLMAKLPPHSLINTIATQATAYDNKRKHALDFTAVDRVMAAAQRHGQLVSLGLTSQSGICADGHWKDKAWYDGGYRKAFNDDRRGVEPLSFWDYVHVVVPRYRHSPALGTWGLIGEPESSNCAAGYRGAQCYSHLTCPPGAAQSMRRFFDTVGGELKRLDPVHLLTGGMLGGSQCGTAGDDYAYVNASPAIDIVEAHDYGADDEPISTDHLRLIRVADQLDKPFVIGETGMLARNNTPGCMTLTQRRDKLRAKIAAHFAAGAQGFTVWQWAEHDAGNCGFNVLFTDPAWSLFGSTVGKTSRPLGLAAL